MASSGENGDESESSDRASDSVDGDDQRPGLIAQLFFSPVNLALLALCVFLVYKIVNSRRRSDGGGDSGSEAPLGPMKKRDFKVQELKEFDGRGSDRRILLAVNGKVFDVSKARKTYGPDGPYGVFAGRDASRGLGTFSLKEDVIKDCYDDLSDLTTTEMDKIREWEKQFQEKYDCVGRLLKDNEEATDYSDTEEERSFQDKSKND